jgi:uncharacterized protein (UPF0335 family)
VNDADMIASLTLRRDFLETRIEKAEREGRNLSHDKREAAALTKVIGFWHEVMRRKL